MSKALSLDLRTRVLAAVAGGPSHRQAGDRFGVSAASVSRWRAREPSKAILVPRRWAAIDGRGASTPARD